MNFEQNESQKSAQSTAVLSIIVPVYNEKYTVDQVLREAFSAKLPHSVRREIIVIDDGSTDGTWDVLDRVAQELPGVKLLRHERNKGKGAAVRTALQHVSGTYVIIQDADLEYSPSEYAKMLEPVLTGVADVVYGSRFLVSAGRRVLFFWHSVGNKVLTTLSNIFTNLSLTDMETGYKLMPACVLKSIPIRCDGFGIEAELTMKLSKRGMRFFEVPISYFGRTYSEGKKITWRDALKTLFVLLYYWIVDDIYQADDYGRDILHSLSETPKFNRWMADQIRPWIGDDVLEIGAGIGNLTRCLLPRNSYTITDVDPLYLGYLRNSFGRNRRISVAKVDLASVNDFEGLRNRFDTVICLNVLEHVSDEPTAMANIFSALRPGGRAVILVPSGPQRYGSLDEVLGHVRRYTAADLEHAFKQAGFRVEKIWDFNRIGVSAWLINGKLLKRRYFGRVQLKLFDWSIWLWRYVDRWLPWSGLSLIGVGQKTADGEKIDLPQR